MNVRRLRVPWRSGDGGLVLGLCFLLLLPLLAALGLYPNEPFRVYGDVISQPPSSQHWFGTDSNGFDIFSRSVVASLLDLPLALSGTLVGLVAGVAVGLVAGQKGRLGEGIMRFLDGFQAFPLLILTIAFVSLAGQGIATIAVAVGIVTGPRFTRLVRSESLSLRETRFIDAAIAMGAKPSTILRRHILPNVTGVVLVEFSLGAAQAMRVIAALSFLGVGITPPTASWGTMVQQGARGIAIGQWWISLFPAGMIVLAIISLNLIADRLSDRFDRSEA